MYFFRHDLVKQALYESLLNYNKKIIHGVIVDMMAEQKPLTRFDGSITWCEPADGTKHWNI
jgi:hypothetical protein